MRSVELVLPELHPAQEQVKQERKRGNVIVWGRRAGKTTLNVDLMVEGDVLRYPVAYFAPTYKDMLEVWRTVVPILSPITGRVSKSEYRIENIAGGVLEFWSLQNPDAGRGRKYARVLIDEGSLVGDIDRIFFESIIPTLTDFRGDAYISGTPKGRNGFWRLFQLGRNPDDEFWKSWNMPTTVNPYISADEVELIRRSTPNERFFQQEYLAMFLDDAGGLFRHVADAATAELIERGIPGRQYVMGIDLARKVDYTAVTVLDISDPVPRCVFVDRFHRVDWKIQVNRIKTAVEAFGPELLMVDATGVGDPIVEQLRDDLTSHRLKVEGVQITRPRKLNMVDALALAFERREIEIVPDRDLIDELQSFEASTYAAPTGGHDDLVMSLALAYWGARTPVEDVEILDFNPFYG